MTFGEATRECNAKSKRSGVKCRGAAVRGSDKCRMHGGKAKKGKEASQFKHGFFSDSWTGKQKEIYDLLASGGITAREAAEQAHALAVARMQDMIEAAKLDPSIKSSQGYSHAHTECRLAARGLMEIEREERQSVDDEDIEGIRAVNISIRPAMKPDGTT